MRFVPVKSLGRSDFQALHRDRERLVAERTPLFNHLGALLLERRIVAPRRRRKLAAMLEAFVEQPATTSPSVAPFFTAKHMDRRVGAEVARVDVP